MSRLHDSCDMPMVVDDDESQAGAPQDPWIRFLLALAIANRVNSKLDHEFRNLDSTLRERIARSVERWEW